MNGSLTDLEKGDLEVVGLLPGASNYSLLAELQDGQNSAAVVYKPRRGETPLWDFSSGTLCQREVAAFLLADAAGWDFVPPTVLRNGPLGTGAVQLYIDHDPEITAFDLLSDYEQELRRIALFDVVSNNADRKAGHVLIDSQNKIWAVDHGLCFHDEPKLRTVLWDFVEEPFSASELKLLTSACEVLDGGSSGLEKLLSPKEASALRARIEACLAKPVFPPPGPGRPYPWPPI